LVNDDIELVFKLVESLVDVPDEMPNPKRDREYGRNKRPDEKRHHRGTSLSRGGENATSRVLAAWWASAGGPGPSSCLGHSTHEIQLLPVLLAEIRMLGLGDVQELQDHGQDSIEMPGPVQSSVPVGLARRVSGAVANVCA
jgi:hypothetical protein